ncbi:MAG: hypothetical protein GY953_26920, partial [bacterium]|nr:hypothetical protein [bacterium]
MKAVVEGMLEVLAERQPAPESRLPAPNVTIASVRERPVGLGAHRGDETRGPLRFVSGKGVRLEGEVRFQLWGKEPRAVDKAVLALHAKLLADHDVLRRGGFLRLDATATSPAEQVDKSWRKTADYGVLYEYHYQDSDDTRSLIVQVQIDGDPEEPGSPDRETTVVTGEMARWDNEGAPRLRVAGPDLLGGLLALAYLPATPTGGATLLRTHQGAVGSPVDHSALDNFLAAVAGPGAAERHAR